MALSRQLLTLQAFLRLPEQEPPLEYVNGLVTQKMSPKIRHAAIQGAAIKLIDGFAMPRQLARAFPELRTTFGNASFVPDVAVFVWDRIPTDERGELPDEVFEPPDIAIEVASPGQTTAALSNRCRWYVDNGVRVALLADPRRRVVRAFRPGRQPVVHQRNSRIDLGDVIPGFSFTANELFAALRAR